MAMCSPVFLASFWCLPTRFLRGQAAAAGIALISAIGASGGFFGPNLIGVVKQTTGGDAGAFWAFAGLTLVGGLVCIGLRQMAVFKPGREA